MKQCSNCGNENMDGAVFCTNCGTKINDKVQVYLENDQVTEKKKETNNPLTGLKLASLILMFVGVGATSLSFLSIAIIPYVGWLFALVLAPAPIAYGLPMAFSYLKKVKNGEPVSVGFKVCTLIFLSMIAGILMLVDKD